MKLFKCFVLSVLVISLSQCKKDPAMEEDIFSPTPFEHVSPAGFPTINNIPTDNRSTLEGIALGRKLFYDSILSGDNSLSCGGCHAQQFAFSDNNKVFSEGINGSLGGRNTPAIINVLWSNSMFWDGRAATVEMQALGPVPNEVEMNIPWVEAIIKLQAHADYPALFEAAFDSITITKTLVAKAIAQFERTLVSANSKYDRYLAGTTSLTAEEQRGHDIFFSEKGDCFHCHGGALLSDNKFHNNGLDAFFDDKGLGDVTGNSADDGRFKSPTLRNISVTAPYMHDGRFANLMDVIDFYSEDIEFSATIDPILRGVANGGLQLDSLEKADLLAFLETLTDTTFLNNPDFSPKL